MPLNTPCVRCGRVGFVRRETQIKGNETVLAFYCGACDHSWRIAEGGKIGLASETNRPDRSRAKPTDE